MKTLAKFYKNALTNQFQISINLQMLHFLVSAVNAMQFCLFKLLPFMVQAANSSSDKDLFEHLH